MKYLCVLAATTMWLISVTGYAQSADEVRSDVSAIKKVIEGLTTAAYAGDYKSYLTHWADTKYVSRVGSYPGNAVTKVTGDEYRKQLKEAATKPSEPSKDNVIRDNWLIRVNGNSAFVIFDQYNTRPDGTVRHSVEERYLERLNTDWKIVNVTVLVDAPTNSAADQAAIKKVIEDEVQYNRQRDVAKWLNCFVKSDDLVFGFFPGMARGYDAVAKGLKDSVEKNPQPSKNTGVISDYRIRQQGNTAFVTCIQIETAPDGTQTQWNKAEYLEKQNGEWKIVANLFRSEPVAKPK